MLTDVNGMDTSASLTDSQYLTLVSSDLKVFEIDKENVQFLGKAPATSRFGFRSAKLPVLYRPLFSSPAR